MKTSYLVLGIAVMAITTYIIRALPMVVFRKRINNVWVRSFLHYVPYAVLSAMTFPAVFESTGTIWSAALAMVVAVVLAYFRRGLLTVAIGASVTAFIMLYLGM